MTIEELIEQGEQIKISCRKSYDGGIEYYQGQAYEDWLTIAIRFLNQHYPQDPETIRFSEIAKKANGFGDHKYQPLIGILRAFKAIGPIKNESDIYNIIEVVCMNFNKFDRNIKRRYGSRSTIEITDEYDVQDALFSILKLFTDDIRPEDFVPSYAGSNSRVDFLLPEHNIILETKMTNKNLSDKQIGEQLVIDIARYRSSETFKHLICFVYDKGSYISNPVGLKRDLEKLSNNEIKVTVLISPL